MTYRYRVFGLCLNLPFQVGQLSPAPTDAPVDIDVHFDETPQSLPQLHHMGRNDLWGADVQVSTQGDMLWTTATARFWVRGGNSILVEPLVDLLQPASVRRFVLYTCIPGILNQRGMLVLHANAVVGPEGAIAFTGRSGAGKSTLLAALMVRGLPMLADDVTVLQVGSQSTPLVLPGYPSYRLTGDTLTQMTPLAERMIAVGGDRDKYMIFAPKTTLYTTSVPLHSLYLLTPHPQESLEIERVEGLQAFQLIQDNCYQPAGMLLSPNSFQGINQVAQTCALYQIYRPTNRWTVNEIADLLLAPKKVERSEREAAQWKPIS